MITKEDKLKDNIAKSFERWITQTARENNCKDEDVVLITHKYLTTTFAV